MTTSAAKANRNAEIVDRLEAEIERLRAVLKRIDAINDNPARYNSDINAVIIGALGDAEQQSTKPENAT